MQSARELLHQTFGFHDRPGQEEVIAHLTAGKSAASDFPARAYHAGMEDARGVR